MNFGAVAMVLGNLLAVLVMPFVVIGVVNRVKSLWSGRKGPPILQVAFDVLRLLRKRPVYSTTTTPLFRIAPWVFLVTGLGSAAICPLLGSGPVVAFPFDFVWFAYAYGLGRVAMLLAALDTGSPFEGMGAAREAIFAAVLEPALFLVVGALCAFTGSTSLHEALVLPISGGASMVVLVASVLALVVVLQVETGRLPVDDPATHLELTMVHEVMVLDHSGPLLGLVEYAAALKLFVLEAMLLHVMAPTAAVAGWPGFALFLAGLAGVAVAIGLVESVMARLRLLHVPTLLIAAVLSCGFAFLLLAR